MSLHQQVFILICSVFALLVNSLAFAGGHVSKLGRTGDAAVIHAGRALVIPGDEPRDAITIATAKGRIIGVADGYQPAEFFAGEFRRPENVPIIDLKDSFVLPGLMDAHVHIMAQPSTFVGNARFGGGPLSKADLALSGFVYAERTLAAGFTTIRDVGSNNESVMALRDAINQGLLPGPTILTAGPTLSATGGHGDRGFGAIDTLDPDERRADGVCDGPDECAQAVRHNIKLGVDLIKFTATGGYMSKTGTEQQYEAEEMQAIVATAHQRGIKVAAHVYSADAARVALDAGADSLEHGWLLDKRALRQMKKQGTYLVPTLLISRPSTWADLTGTSSANELRNQSRTFENAVEMGVNIAFGTDVGIFDHGQNALEFDVMVELGMTPAQAIYSATVATADLFGIVDEAGTLEVGKRADIIAVSGDPLEDVSILQAVQFVMKSGAVLKVDGNYKGAATTRRVGPAVKF